MRPPNRYTALYLDTSARERTESTQSGYMANQDGTVVATASDWLPLAKQMLRQPTRLQPYNTFL
jgi:hypothetical protein